MQNFFAGGEIVGTRIRKAIRHYIPTYCVTAGGKLSLRAKALPTNLHKKHAPRTAGVRIECYMHKCSTNRTVCVPSTHRRC